MTQETHKSGMRVEIFDQAFNLHGTDPSYIRMLAEFVDSKIRAVRDETHTSDSTRLAVLAALSIAENYHLLKTKLEGDASDSSSKTFTGDDRQRVRERRQRHHTKRWCERELLGIVDDKSLPAKVRHQALRDLGRLRGYYRAAQKPSRNRFLR